MEVREAARTAVEESRERLLSLSHRIHAHPELGFEEVQACEWVAAELDAAGLEVRTGIGQTGGVCGTGREDDQARRSTAC